MDALGLTTAAQRARSFTLLDPLVDAARTGDVVPPAEVHVEAGETDSEGAGDRGDDDGRRR